MLMEVKNHLRVILLSIKYNIMREMTNRASFITNVIFMMLNNATFIIQWLVLFNFKNDIGGYQLNDVLMLWGLASSCYGFSHILFNKAFDMSDLIVNGKLDSFLIQPKNVLISTITSSTSASAIGDLIYGFIILLLFNFSLYRLILFTIFVITGGLIITALAVIFGSISFWIVRGDILAYNLSSILFHVNTYPDGIFKGVVRLLLYTIVPAGIIAYLPISTLKIFSWGNLGIILGVTIIFISLAFVIFNKGLKRYSSSNLMVARI